MSIRAIKKNISTNFRILRNRFRRLLIRLGIMKPPTKLKGRLLSKFPGDFESFLVSYKAILKKESKLTASRRAFVSFAVRDWLRSNGINIEHFDSQLLKNEKAA